jgi:6-hydroxycyclohex-1-ene-1-carbonyl-CoA dehydrogenase
VADAGTTPYQAIKKSDFEPGDNIIVIGIGGVGQYLVQEAKALGAGTVIAIDIGEDRLKKMLSYGADFVINSRDKGPKDVSGEFKAIRKQNGLPGFGWKIFEVTGSKSGQEIALSLLSFTGKLIVVGFGMAKVEYSISRLMAFDAAIIGTWACLPEYYPAVMDMVLSGRVALEPFVQTKPMSSIAETFEEIHSSGSPEKRVVLVPDF